MPIVLNGSGTISGVNVGGLPDGIVDSDMLASGVGGKALQYKQYQAVGSYSTTSTSWASISSDFEFDLPNVATNSNVLIHFTATKGTTTTDVVMFKIVRTKGGVSTDLGMNTTADFAGRTATMLII